MFRAGLLINSDIRMGARPKETLIAGLLVMSMPMAIGGCDFKYYYSKPGASQQERAKDHYECKQESQKFTAVAMRGTMVAGSDPDWTTYKECLQARGYTVQTEDEREQMIEGQRQLDVQQKKSLESQQALLRLKEYESLMDEKRRLDRQKQLLDAEPNSIERNQRIEEHNRQVKEYDRRLSIWNSTNPSTNPVRR